MVFRVYAASPARSAHRCVCPGLPCAWGQTGRSSTPTRRRSACSNTLSAHWLDAVHPEDRHRLTEASRAALAGTPVRVAARFEGADGHNRLVRLVLSAAEAGVLDCVLLDFGESDDLIEHSQAFYQAFLEQSPVGVVHLDREGVVTFKNHRFRQMTGEADTDAWIGQSVFEIVGLGEDLLSVLDAMLNEGDDFALSDVVFQPNRTTTRRLRVHGAPIRLPEGGCVGGVLMVYDLTLEREREDALRVRARYDAAEQALRQTALQASDPHAFLGQAVTILGQTSGSDVAHLLLQTGEQYEPCTSWSVEGSAPALPHPAAWALARPGRGVRLHRPARRRRGARARPARYG